MSASFNKEKFEGKGFNLVGRGGKLDQFERNAPPRFIFEGKAISGHRFGHAGSEGVVVFVLERGQDFRAGRAGSHWSLMHVKY